MSLISSFFALYIIHYNLNNIIFTAVIFIDFLTECIFSEEAVTGNKLTINGDTSGEFGFNLDTGTGGDINFDENTESHLISLNRDSSVNTERQRDC